jgi:HSP20 family protein
MTMPDEIGSRQVPVRVYRTADRLMVAMPLPGVRPEDIVVEVDGEGRLIVDAAAAGGIKEEADKELLLDEWDGRPYHRELVLPMTVEADHATVSYGNGVLVLALPLHEQMRPARLTLEPLELGHAVRVGSAGHPIRPVSTEEHRAARDAQRPKHGGQVDARADAPSE